MRKLKLEQHWWLLCLVTAFLQGCGNEPIPTSNVTNFTDTPDSGIIHISVDESFKPVIDEQIKVYQSSHPNATIVADYKPEAACFKDLQNDNTRLVITARGLNKAEKRFFDEKLQFSAMQSVVAYDAVAIIVNRSNNDSLFTLPLLKKMLNGSLPVTIVMDGKTATSTVRYLQDSILRGQAFGKNVVAAKNSADVVQMVSENKNAIGFVGLSWVGDNYDKKQQQNLQKIRLGLVACTICDTGMYAKPSQATITFSQYPLARPLYCIVKENATGLGTGFLNFLSLERGQLIFRRSFLAPAKMGFMRRTTNL